MKLQCQLLGGLVVTVGQIDASTAPQLELELMRGIASLLQYDGNTIANCDAIDLMESAQDVHGAPRCIVAVALRCQILASIGYPTDITPLRQVLEAQGTVYEPWELLHVKAVMTFCVERNFDKTMVQASEAIAMEPRDIFSVRLLFIAAFMCGAYDTLRQHLSIPLRFYSRSDAIEASESALVEHLLTPLELWLQDSASPRNAGALHCFLKQNTQFPLHHDAPSALVLPFLMTYYAFAVEETAFDCSNDGPLRAELLQHVERWNNAAMAVIHVLNHDTVCGGDDGDNNTLVNLASLRPLAHPFAMHVVCHLYEALGDPLRGLEAVYNKVPRELWANTAHLVTHCWWHVSLFHMDAGDPGAALRVFDAHIAPAIAKEDPFGISDATAFLTRAALCGILDPAKDSARFDAVQVLWAYHLQDAERHAVLCHFPFFSTHAMMSQWTASLPPGKAMAEVPVPRCPASDVVYVIMTCLDRNPFPHLMQPSGTATYFPSSDERGAETALTAVSSMWAQRDQWGLIGGSGAQRELLVRVVLYCVARLVAWSKREATLVTASFQLALRDIVKSVQAQVSSKLKAMPHQLFYLNMWKDEVESW